MLTIILIAIGVPVLAGTAYLALRNTRPQFLADVRGIALQTVIIMVVLLAIAGAVAGVLIARGDDAVTNLQAQDDGVFVATVLTEPACENVGGRWITLQAGDTGGDGTNGCYTG